MLQAMDTTESAVPAHEVVMEHPLDVGSPTAVGPILDGSQKSQDEPAAELAKAALHEVWQHPLQH